jgi:type I restriction-modification system DNA methylase subunit
MEQHSVITGELKSKIDVIWNAFWSGGISNPMEVMEQLTYLLFLRRLDELHTLEENKANRLKQPMERRIFPEGLDPRGCNYNDYRWSRFKHFSPATMFEVIGEHVFPFLKTIGSDDSTYSHHMRDARFTIPTPALLARVVDLLDGIPMDDRDTKGDVYEYMLGKIASAGQNGQFRTPRHIIQLMVELAAADLLRICACEDEARRYFTVVDRAEIGENEFNLNLPRYVDTFEPERVLPLSQAAKQLVAASMAADGAQSALQSLLTSINKAVVCEESA